MVNVKLKTHVANVIFLIFKNRSGCIWLHSLGVLKYAEFFVASQEAKKV
jgi:hypothetical protein